MTGRISFPTTTPRLALRPLAPADAEPLFALFNDWQVVRFLSAPPWPYKREDAIRFIENAISADNETERTMAITQAGTLIGAIGIRMRGPSHLQRDAGPNIGYWLGRAYWGRGFMTEIVQACVAHLFETGPGDAIYSGAFTENAASLAVQQKIGFQPAGETQLYSNPRGAELPHTNTILTKACFRASRP